MLGRSARWCCGLVLAVGITVAGSALAQTAADARKVNAEATRLYRSGKYSEAEPLYKSSIIILEKVLGKDHPEVGTEPPLVLRRLFGLSQAASWAGSSRAA